MMRIGPLREVHALTLRRAMGSLAMSVMLPMLAGAQEMREITGEAVYRERRALEPDAQLVVELTHRDGRFVAESRTALEGRQMPLGFALQGGAGRDYRLRGAIFEAGVPVFLSEVMAVPAGTGPLALGPVLFRAHRPMGFAMLLRCGARGVEFGVLAEGARLRVDGAYIDLVAVSAASGARFADPQDDGTWAWSKGNEVTISLRGERLESCGPAVPGGLLPLRAQGNEPSWTLEMGEDRMLFVAGFGATRIEAALPDPEVLAEGLRFVLPEQVEIRIGRDMCRDAMSGMPYPHEVTVVVEDEEYRGCGGDPRDLLAGPVWEVASVAGEDVPGDAEVTLDFDAGGRVSGRSGCNRFSGGYVLTGEGLRFGPAVATRMACAPELMDLERRMFDALTLVDRFDIADDGGLTLFAADRPVLLARRGERF